MSDRIRVIYVNEEVSAHALFLGSSEVEPQHVAEAIIFFNQVRLLFALREKITYIAVDCYKSKINGRLELSIGHGETTNVKHMHQLDRNKEMFGLSMMYLIGMHRAMLSPNIAIKPNHLRDRVLSFKNRVDNFDAVLTKEANLDNKLVKCDYTNAQFRASYQRIGIKTPDFSTAPKLVIQTDTAIKA